MLILRKAPARAQRQIPLPLPRADYVAPTMTLHTAAKAILRCTEEQVRELVDDGALVAWDIRTDDASRSVLRLLTQSVVECQRDNPDFSPCYHSMIAPDFACKALLPDHEKPFVTGPEVKNALLFGRQHLINLVDAGTLAQLPGTHYRRGPGGWPVIDRQSYITFLETRIVGGI